MLTNKKIEVKSERDTWAGTNNICIEYESWGKPSGIRATEADYWFHNLCIGDEEYCTLVFKTDVLKKIVDKLDTFKTVSGGDHASRMFLVNLPKLFSTDVIKAFELDDDTKSNKNEEEFDLIKPDNYNKFTSESGHWYSRRRAVYTIIGANGRKNTTLRDAKTLGLVPSVTTIIGMIAKPSLENWKINQALNSALSLERYETNRLMIFTRCKQTLKRLVLKLQNEVLKYMA